MSNWQPRRPRGSAPLSAAQAHLARSRGSIMFLFWKLLNRSRRMLPSGCGTHRSSPGPGRSQGPCATEGLRQGSATISTELPSECQVLGLPKLVGLRPSQRKKVHGARHCPGTAAGAYRPSLTGKGQKTPAELIDEVGLGDWGQTGKTGCQRDPHITLCPPHHGPRALSPQARAQPAQPEGSHGVAHSP